MCEETGKWCEPERNLVMCCKRLGDIQPLVELLLEGLCERFGNNLGSLGGNVPFWAGRVVMLCGC